MNIFSKDIVKIEYEAPEINLSEVKRYSKIRDNQGKEDFSNDETKIGCDDKFLDEMLSEMLDEILPLLSYRVCYRYMEEENAIYFGATLGIEIDRIINKYGKISPARALIAQGIGAERIESLCDMFENDVVSELKENGLSSNRRISPGYGNFTLDNQRRIFDILDLPKMIGLTLNESLIMSPSKSVTAVIKIKDSLDGDFEKSKEDSSLKECHIAQNKESFCESCEKLDCEYRK